MPTTSRGAPYPQDTDTNDVPGRLKDLADWVSLMIMPVGGVIAYAGDTAPTGWLVCDGSAVLRQDYPNLFAAIGTAHGAGNGTTTFNLPDLRDRVPVGASASKALGSKGGAAAAQAPDHTHYVPSHSHNIGVSINNASLNVGLYGAGTGNQHYQLNDIGNHTHGASGSASATDMNTAGMSNNPAFSVQNPYQALNHIIRFS